jgi:hypothetical protein
MEIALVPKLQLGNPCLGSSSCPGANNGKLELESRADSQRFPTHSRDQQMKTKIMLLIGLAALIALGSYPVCAANY